MKDQRKLQLSLSHITVSSIESFSDICKIFRKYIPVTVLHLAGNFTNHSNCQNSGILKCRRLNYLEMHREKRKMFSWGVREEGATRLQTDTGFP
jgi:hypothetical protein